MWLNLRVTTVHPHCGSVTIPKYLVFEKMKCFDIFNKFSKRIVKLLKNQIKMVNNDFHEIHFSYLVVTPEKK